MKIVSVENSIKEIYDVAFTVQIRNKKSVDETGLNHQISGNCMLSCTKRQGEQLKTPTKRGGVGVWSKNSSEELTNEKTIQDE